VLAPSGRAETIARTSPEDPAMRYRMALALVALGVAAPSAPAYVEAAYSLGQVCHESTTIVLVEVAKVNKEKNLIIYKKLRDLKGTHPQQEIKHNIGQNGKHPREWQNVMAWAEVGKKAVFFHNGSASETCIGTYWYQCYPEGEWWGMSHAEPYLLRTYCGGAERLAAAVGRIQEGQEVVVPCLADGNLEQLHERKGKVQQLKASLKRLNYDAKRDFVAFGAGDDKEGVELKTVVLLAQSTASWKFLPAKQVAAVGDRWREPGFDDKGWRTGKAPIGYGEDEILKRKGTVVQEQGVPFVFRRELDVSADLLNHQGVRFHLNVASDDSALVYVNGALVDQDPVEDHEFAYWNREVGLQPKQFKAGRNVIAVFVKNHQGSSDIYLDLEVSAQFALPAKPMSLAAKAPAAAPGQPAKAKLIDDKERPGALTVNQAKRTVTVECAIAPRKLPNLADIYPIEVIACYPAPRGQKAHETVVTFTGVKPSSVHKALAQLGLKPGKPAVGAGMRAEGPELKIYLEFPGKDSKAQRLPIEQTLVDRKTNKPIGMLKWHFTGSALKQPDPEKDDKVYGADLSGTLLTLLPVTDDVVIQSNLKAEDEPAYKVETNKAVLPKIGTPAKLVIEVK
jgi:hypothetical protein